MAAAAPVANAAAAVARMRAAMLAARAPPAASAESLAAIEETAAALAEIREMQEPDLKRAPRAEGGAAAADEAAQGPTRESDAAHLTWQMRRALLCQRWALTPIPGAAATEDVYCNAICGAALTGAKVDGEIDVDFLHRKGPECEWQLDLLRSLLPGSDEDLAKHRPHFAKVLAFARGGTLQLVKGGKSRQARDGETTHQVIDGVWWPSVHVVAELAAQPTQLQQIATRLGLKGLQMFMQGLPGSLVNGGKEKPSKTMADTRAAHPPTVRTVYPGRNVCEALDHVVAVVTGLQTADGLYVLVFHDLYGAPHFMSNRGFPSPRLAFEGFVREQRHGVVLEWVGHLRQGAVLSGDGTADSDVGEACPASSDNAEFVEWRRKLCGPSNAVRAALIRAGAEHVSYTDDKSSLVRLRTLVHALSLHIESHARNKKP